MELTTLDKIWISIVSLKQTLQSLECGCFRYFIVYEREEYWSTFDTESLEFCSEEYLTAQIFEGCE